MVFWLKTCTGLNRLTITQTSRVLMESYFCCDLRLEYTLGPCRDVSSTVVCIALKHKLSFASLTRLQGPKRHAIW